MIDAQERTSFLAAVIFGMIWTQIYAHRITARQISMTDVARPRFGVLPGLLFALAVSRNVYIDRLVAAHLMYERVWACNVCVLPDVNNFDNFLLGVIYSVKTMIVKQFKVIFEERYFDRIRVWHVCCLPRSHCFACRFEMSRRKWHALLTEIFKVVSK